MNEQNAKQEPPIPLLLDGIQIWREADDLVIMHLPGTGLEDATGEVGEIPTPETDALQRRQYIESKPTTTQRKELREKCRSFERRIATLTAELAEERNQRQYFEELAIGKAATEAAEGLAKDGFISDAARSAGREGV